MPHTSRVATFKSLHTASTPLVLANAWDAASAALFQREGATAVATSSASLAWSLGYADGGKLPRNELLAAVARIQRVLTVPLSVDLEDGYSDAPGSVAELVVELARLGVAGINLEDGSKDPSLLADKIKATRQALGDTPLFINARTDVYLRGLASGPAAVGLALQRAQAYQAAGADGLFVPGLASVDDTALIARQSDLPLNIMLRFGIPSIQVLHGAGARRFSAGPATFQSAYGHARTAAQDLLKHHSVTGLFHNTVTYDAMNTLFS